MRPTNPGIVAAHVTTTLDSDSERGSGARAHRFSLPDLFATSRRAADPRKHSLNQSMVFSSYNNYLNDCIFSDPRLPAHAGALPRRARLEHLADKFWLRDGAIDEDMFEESSDEEDV